MRSCKLVRWVRWLPHKASQWRSKFNLPYLRCGSTLDSRYELVSALPQYRLEIRTNWPYKSTDGNKSQQAPLNQDV